MAYTPHHWSDGDTIKTEHLNTIEKAIADATSLDTKETISNKITNIENYKNDDTKYPSAKAVYELFYLLDASNTKF